MAYGGEVRLHSRLETLNSDRRSTMRLTCVLLGAALVAGCDLTTESDEPRWVATLEATPSFSGVSGTAEVSTSTTSSTARISLAGGAAGAAHPWHLHLGTCGTGGPIVGEPAAYPPLQPGSDGRDTQVAVIGIVLTGEQSFFVNVHASRDDFATTVACGDLTMSPEG
jgi:hypothetical protein